MSSKNDSEIYIQKGVRKVYYNKDIRDDYVVEFSNDVRNRDSYCIDSRGADSFFYVVEDTDGYRLIECNKDIGVNRYISLNELNYGYIKLSDFLRDAKYIGRGFKRIEPVITYYGTDIDICRIIDNMYLEIDGYDNKYIVLYEKDNIFLVKYMFGYNEWYSIIDCRYIQDGNYQFYGKVYEEYKNIDRVYLEIMEQINSFSKKEDKIRVKIR